MSELLKKSLFPFIPIRKYQLKNRKKKKKKYILQKKKKKRKWSIEIPCIAVYFSVQFLIDVGTRCVVQIYL